ncbi:MAG: hypothetical protein HQ478_16320 [Chloroflexi bacterium]|nr:hypothetical protein [Chloroflexota bacterium]
MVDFVPEAALKVVIADDAEEKIEAFQALLAGYVELDAIGVTSAEKCISVLQSGGFDALFISLAMPHASGFMVLRAISGGSLKRPRFIGAISEWSDVDSGRLADENADTDVVINRPYNYSQIQAVVTQLASSTLEDDLLESLFA